MCARIIEHNNAQNSPDNIHSTPDELHSVNAIYWKGGGFSYRQACDKDCNRMLSDFDNIFQLQRIYGLI